MIMQNISNRLWSRGKKHITLLLNPIWGLSLSTLEAQQGNRSVGKALESRMTAVHSGNHESVLNSKLHEWSNSNSAKDHNKIQDTGEHSIKQQLNSYVAIVFRVGIKNSSFFRLKQHTYKITYNSDENVIQCFINMAGKRGNRLVVLDWIIGSRYFCFHELSWIQWASILSFTWSLTLDFRQTKCMVWTTAAGALNIDKSYKKWSQSGCYMASLYIYT